MSAIKSSKKIFRFELKSNIFNILHGSKSCKSVLKNVNPEWIVTADVHVDTHVELAVVDEVRTT